MRMRIPRYFVFVLLGLLLAAALLMTGAAQAQGGQLAPPEIPGAVVYVPFPVAIAVDGKLSDWAGVPVQKVTQGPLPSSDPKEDGSFTFSVAADAANFYINMQAVDTVIVAGKHGQDFWNEDSLEFYLNLSGDLNLPGYTDDVYQVNVNAADIGNTDPAALTFTGLNGNKLGLQGYVFKTATGWGLELSCPRPEKLKLQHGYQFGFQAQLNGASRLDRDVQLSWSNADMNNVSWQKPKVFGRGIMFEVGQTDIPEPVVLPTSTPTPTPKPVPVVAVNQAGYYPDAPKRAAYAAASSDAPLSWKLLDASNKEVAAGQTTPLLKEAASGDTVQVADFSAFKTEGKGYMVEVDGKKSYPFDISNSLYSNLKYDALMYFYHTRSGITIEAQYVGKNLARPAGHLSDNAVTCYQGKDKSGQAWPGCNYTLDASGGWYDAGDWGKYVVNGGITVWTLLNAYERNPAVFADGALNIPEKNNGVPDLLDEARWEMDFMLRMQVPAGQELAGMAHHKLHDAKWAAMPAVPPTYVDETSPTRGRFLFPPSTAATLNLAATGAQCARVWKNIDAEFSNRCLTAARAAWEAALSHPEMYAPSFDAGGGDYGDKNVLDDFYWAASELYITTGETAYRDYLVKSSYFAQIPALAEGRGGAAMNWGNTAVLGTLSLALAPNGLPAEDIAKCRQQITAMADVYLVTESRQAYGVPVTFNDYYWGSNGGVANNVLIMGLAHDLTGDKKYLDGMTLGMDYLLGSNPNIKSYVSGYGENPMQHPHHRFWANQDAYPPPPPGVLAGGPDFALEDDLAKQVLAGCAPAKCYIDDIRSFATNEVAINWNAPLAWIAWYLDARVANPVAAAPTLSAPTLAAPATATAMPAPAATPAPAAGGEVPLGVWVAIVIGVVVAAGAGVSLVLRRRK